VVTFRTGFGVDTGCVAALDNNIPLQVLGTLASGTWQEQWTFIPEPTLVTSNFIIRAGHGNNYASIATTNGVFIRVDPASSANIQFDLMTNGSLTATADSGLAWDPNATSYTFKLRSDGAKIYYSVAKNGGAFSTEKSLCSSGCDMTASLPAFSSSPFFQIYHGPTSDSAEKRVYLHRYSFSASGVQ
jgi:hypothetical protein